MTYRSSKRMSCHPAGHYQCRSRDRRSGPSRPALRQRRRAQLLVHRLRRCCRRTRGRAETGRVARPWTKQVTRVNRRRCCARYRTVCLWSWIEICQDGALAWCRPLRRPWVRARSSWWSSSCSYRCCHRRWPLQLLARPANAAAKTYCCDRMTARYRW